MVALAGCVGSPAPSLDSSDPGARIAAVQRLAAEGDGDAEVAKLIELLDSDDAAERFFAIGTLRKMTGETFGYDHSAAGPDREPAVQRWNEWYAARPVRSQPGGGAGGGAGADR